MHNRLSGTFVGLSCLIVACTADAAGDGIKRIKQPSSFPYLITAPGSYMLVANITVPNANTTAIKVQADNVKINLNGFTIKGVNTCDPFSHLCTSVGSGIGIDADTSDGVVVLDGAVAGMGSHGILLQSGRVERVRLVDNGHYGLLITGSVEAGRVESVTASHNGGVGIGIDGGVVSNCLATNNNDQGIEVGLAGVLIHNHVEGNGGHGILAGGDGGVVILGNALSVNGCSGVLSPNGPTVIGNASVGNDLNGIDIQDGTVSLNVANDNQLSGIQAGGAVVANSMNGNEIGLAGGGYALNHIDGSQTSEVSGGIEVGANLCGGDLTCP